MAVIRYNESVYKRTDRIRSNSGCPEIDTFKLEHPNTGGVRLKKTGTKNLYKVIQANKVNCDLQSVLEQCVHQNQLAVCSPDDVTSAIADFSGLKGLSEWYAGIKNLEQTWRNTPLEVKEQFNSSKVAFINEIGSPDFVEKINKGYANFNDAYKKRIQVPKPNPLPDDVKPNESTADSNSNVDSSVKGDNK